MDWLRLEPSPQRQLWQTLEAIREEIKKCRKRRVLTGNQAAATEAIGGIFSYGGNLNGKSQLFASHFDAYLSLLCVAQCFIISWYEKRKTRTHKNICNDIKLNSY